MNIKKIKKIVDNIYFILICAGFLALISFYPIMLLILGAFVIFRIYINNLYEDEISGYTYKMTTDEFDFHMKFENYIKEIKEKEKNIKLSDEFKQKLIQRLNEELNDNK